MKLMGGSADVELADDMTHANVNHTKAILRPTLRTCWRVRTCLTSSTA
ncbi:MAG: hypothetical protein ACE141_16030 [Bryobacteraceae bacterium]